MIIGGIQKHSLIDYSSKISCVIFTAGCNFDCPYCHNPELVNPPFTTIDQADIFAFLDKRKYLLDGVVITGGEPTLQKDLSAFCKKIKTMGFPIKIDTNGSHPRIIQSLIENKSVDYIAMDIKTHPSQYSPHITQKIAPKSIFESIDLIRNSQIPHEFRTTCVKPFINPDIIKKISRLIEGADLFVLQQAKINNPVLHPDFFTNQKWQFKTEEIKSFQTIAAPFVKNTLMR